MSKYGKYNIVYHLQKWMDTVAGQTFLNYAYSWGASIVILGALFKLTHLPGANFMLFIGMGTEVFVFFISAFDRPFDKTADGREIPTHVTEEYLATGKVTYDNGGQAADASQSAEPSVEHPYVGGNTVVGAPSGGASIIIAGGMPTSAVQTGNVSAAADSEPTEAEQPQGVQAGISGNAVVGGATVVGAPAYVPQMSQEEAEALNEAQGSYVEELNTLVETLKKVNEQSTRLTRDSEEMENLNRTLTGISRIYEMQLKGASKQMGTIDEINAQTKKMAEQIDQLNHIYARMIKAMTVNMPAAAPRVNEE